ncbi:uncharacterized protein LOC121523827 [Cheilinus undulatus]|uniref:uncharacterized protein LOC121523827 n=1 Tax=Cheilinus undulatus TaxID=241271 RepID=UPI001BD5B872|nr:uncharacterized protein LOC121523827 [Cheilinus undulatus]
MSESLVGGSLVRGTDANAQTVQFLFFFLPYSLPSLSVKMKLILCCCIFTLVLGFNISAGIIHEIINEKNPVTLRCPGSVRRKVKWSRESNGTRTDIITIYNDVETKHISDPYKYYRTLADKSLRIQKVKVSHSGRYFCNNEAVVDLTVIPSGINILNTKRTSVNLTCPPDVGGSDDPKWSTDAGEIPTQNRIWTLDKSLVISELQLSDSGLYYCDGKPAVYLNVIREDQSDRDNQAKTTTPTTTRRTEARPTTATALLTTPTRDSTTTKQQKPKKKSGKEKKRKKTTPTTSTTTSTPTDPATTGKKTTPTTSTTTSTPTDPATTAAPPQLVYGIAAGSLLLIIIITMVTIVACLKRRRSKKRVKEEEAAPVYDEIQDGLVFQPKHDCSAQNDPMYSTITDLPLMEKTNDTGLQDESPYSFIEDIPIRGNNNGFLQTSESHYFLLQQPKTSENNNELTSAV